MKTDHFAEFRRPYTGVAGNQGNSVTEPEKPGETRSFSAGASVTQPYDPQVTEATGPCLDSPLVTHVTQSPDLRVTACEREKSQQNQGDSEPVSGVTRDTQKSDDDKPATVDKGRATWTRSTTPASRNPLIPPEVRQKIEAIEPDARAKGWPAELLWNGGYWDSPRGLAAVLDAADDIAEVTPDYIKILKVRRDLLRFRRHVG